MENDIAGALPNGVPNGVVPNGVPGEVTDDIVGHTIEYVKPRTEAPRREELKPEKPKPINYKLTFCHITLASQIFSRNNYFPLFRVMTPKDARRRILRKLLGPMEHYIPVLMNHRRREYLSRGKKVRLAKDYGKRKHVGEEDFRYVCPDLDPTNTKHKRLINLLKSKRKLKGKFAYSVYERDTAIVFTGQMEAAVRDGDVSDVMISDFSDKLIIRFRSGDKLTVPIKDWEGDMSFYEGEGATSKETEDQHHYGRQTMGLAQIYEMKEKGCDDDELERLREAKKRRVRPADPEIDLEVKVKKQMKAVLDNLDMDEETDEDLIRFRKIQEALAEEARKIHEEFEAKGEAPPTEEQVAAAQAVQLAAMLEAEGGTLDDEPMNIAMRVGDMAKTEDVGKKLVDAGMEILKKLPTIDEINDIVKSMGDGKRSEVANVSGLNVHVGQDDKFLVGQMVKTTTGEVFVPGQTISVAPGEQKYMPGVTVNVDESPTFVAGLIMANDRNEAVFLPGQSVITESGEFKFAAEGEHIQPADMQQMDVELDVNEMTEDDEERKIARRLAEEEQQRMEEELERQKREKKRMAEELAEREKIAKQQKEREDKEWAKLGAVERAKKERLRIEREKRDLEKRRKEDMERDKLEKERQEKEQEERQRLRAEREEVERRRMERLREEKRKARELARLKQEKEQAERLARETEENESKRKAELAARIEEEDRKRAEELANYVPKEIPRKEIVIDVEAEKMVEEEKKSFRQEEMRRMAKWREIKIKPIKKIVIPVIKKYVPFPPIKISERLQEMQQEILSGNFFVDHRKYLVKRASYHIRFRLYSCSYGFYNHFNYVADFRRRLALGMYR